MTVVNDRRITIVINTQGQPLAVNIHHLVLPPGCPGHRFFPVIGTREISWCWCKWVYVHRRTSNVASITCNCLSFIQFIYLFTSLSIMYKVDKPPWLLLFFNAASNGGWYWYPIGHVAQQHLLCVCATAAGQRHNENNDDFLECRACSAKKKGEWQTKESSFWAACKSIVAVPKIMNSQYVYTDNHWHFVAAAIFQPSKRYLFEILRSVGKFTTPMNIFLGHWFTCGHKCADSSDWLIMRTGCTPALS